MFEVGKHSVNEYNFRSRDAIHGPRLWLEHAACVMLGYAREGVLQTTHKVGAMFA